MTTKKRRLAKQYVLTADEMQALVDFMREVAGLVMSPHGEDTEVEGYLSIKVCDAVDEVLHTHGIKL